MLFFSVKSYGRKLNAVIHRVPNGPRRTAVNACTAEVTISCWFIGKWLLLGGTQHLRDSRSLIS